MAKAKEKKTNVTPIRDPVKAVVKDFRQHMKVTGVKLKTLTYDEVLEKMVDHCQNLLELKGRPSEQGPTV